MLQRSSGTLSGVKASVLFAGIDESEYETVFRCLGAFEQRYRKQEVILELHAPIREVGILDEGIAYSVIDNASGERMIVDKLQPGAVFGEAIVLPGEQSSSVRIEAITDCRVIKISMDNVVTPQSPVCRFRSTIIENLLQMSADRNVAMSRKFDILVHKSIKGRVIAYLSNEMRTVGSRQFSVPFNRGELADYLQVERSALSRELGRMRQEGLIDFHRSTFTILDRETFGMG